MHLAGLLLWPLGCADVLCSRMPWPARSTLGFLQAPCLAPTIPLVNLQAASSIAIRHRFELSIIDLVTHLALQLYHLRIIFLDCYCRILCLLIQQGLEFSYPFTRRLRELRQLITQKNSLADPLITAGSVVDQITFLPWADSSPSCSQRISFNSLLKAATAASRSSTSVLKDPQLSERSLIWMNLAVLLIIAAAWEAYLGLQVTLPYF